MAKTMRKVRVGSVVSTRMDKTAVVEMVWKQRHRVYRKQMRRVTRFYVHDPEGQCADRRHGPHPGNPSDLSHQALETSGYPVPSRCRRCARH